MADDHSDLTKTEARAGTTPGMARYALGFGLALVLIAFIAILIIFMRA